MNTALAKASGLHAVPNHRPLISQTSTIATDPEAAVTAAADLLAALGLDLDNESLIETPRRMAHALLEMTTPRDFEFTTFPNEEDYDELVMVQDIPLQSLCEHHMLPFVGRAHIGYLPDRKVLGLSKLARIAEMFARRLQVQERLTRQIAEAIQDVLQPQGVAVVIEASHMCMVMRGVQKPHSWTVTSSMVGVFKDNLNTRQEFLNLIRHKVTF